MPLLMSLEGAAPRTGFWHTMVKPQDACVDGDRARSGDPYDPCYRPMSVRPLSGWLRGLRGLGATTPVPPPIVPSTFDMYFGPFMAHPVWLAIGIFGGMWLAGSKTGQGLLKKK